VTKIRLTINVQQNYCYTNAKTYLMSSFLRHISKTTNMIDGLCHTAATGWTSLHITYVK